LIIHYTFLGEKCQEKSGRENPIKTGFSTEILKNEPKKVTGKNVQEIVFYNSQEKPTDCTL
jgi:hypothetical protein